MVKDIIYDTINEYAFALKNNGFIVLKSRNDTSIEFFKKGFIGKADKNSLGSGYEFYVVHRRYDDKIMYKVSDQSPLTIANAKRCIKIAPTIDNVKFYDNIQEYLSDKYAKMFGTYIF